MERPSSRAGMHPEKERYVNGGTKPKHKIKSSFSNLLNINRTQMLDKNFNSSDPYMGSYPHMMDPTTRLYMPNSHIYPDHSGYHEPASLPVYPWSQRPRVPAWDVWSLPYAPPLHKDFSRPSFPLHTGAWTQEEEDFTSLPPVVNDVKPQAAPARPGQRRYSDPGVAAPGPDGSSGTSSSGDEDTGAQSTLVQQLLLEMNTLRNQNFRLVRELESTRAQLDMLRVQQASSWRRMGSEYQPGMLADMVRELREATLMREEAMKSRYRRAASSTLPSDHDSPLLVESLKRMSLDLPSDYRGTSQQQRRAEHRSAGSQRNHGAADDHSVQQRLRRQQQGSYSLASSEDDEDFLSSVSGDSSRRELVEQVRQLKRDKSQLSDELRKNRESKTDTFAHVQKLERLVDILRKKLKSMNGVQDCGQSSNAAEVSGPASLHSITSTSSSTGSSMDQASPGPIQTSPFPTHHTSSVFSQTTTIPNHVSLPSQNSTVFPQASPIPNHASSVHSITSVPSISFSPGNTMGSPQVTIHGPVTNL